MCDNNDEFFWKSNKSIREPILFINSEKGLIGKLLFNPNVIESIEVFDIAVGYKKISDYNIVSITPSDSGAEIIITHELIPFIEKSDIIRPHGSENSYGTTIDGKKSIFFSETGLFHKLQTLITYTHKNSWPGHYPTSNSNRLVRSKSLINGNIKKNVEHEKNGIDIFIIGDSISAGGNCSKGLNFPPYIGDYSELLISSINKNFPECKTELHNEAVGGMNSRWGAKNIKKIIESIKESSKNFDFDLNIIGFGVNDASGKMKKSNFKKYIRKMIKTILKINENAEFILISSAIPNPLWIHTHNEFIYQYRIVFKKIMLDYDGKIEIADMSQLWDDIFKNKEFYDLTGNGINHPNDYGHNLYCQVISALLGL